MQYTIDTSRWNGPDPVDWKATGFPLAIIKSSEALGRDSLFAAQWEAARQADIPRAAYHFFRPNVDPTAQALSCWSVIQSAGFMARDYVILDYEVLGSRLPAETLASARTFLMEMAKYTHNPPMIYTYPAFWRQVGGEEALWAKDFPLALAQWPWDNWFLNIKLPPFVWTKAQFAEKKRLIETGEVKPMALKPWTTPDNPYPAIWQFTARADPKQIPGYTSPKKAVDFNCIYLDLGAPPPARTCPTCKQLWPFEE